MNSQILEVVLHNHLMLHHIETHLTIQDQMLDQIFSALSASPELKAAMAALKQKTDALKAAIAAMQPPSVP